jgi:oligoribonuclease NrnB/cAMP/cGMP phosphodiesterase (DHH superfamily)
VLRLHVARGDRARYVQAEHGGATAAVPPRARGEHVVVTDFAYKPAQTAALLAEAASLIVLDHHASAEADLAALPEENKVFEMGMSGATLSWCYFHGHEREVPLLLRYVEDKDLWRWALPESEAFTAGWSTVPQDFAAWDAVLRAGEAGVAGVIERGRAILEYKNRVRDDHVARAVPVRLRGFTELAGLAVNATTQGSEIGNALCSQRGADFAFVWQYDDGGSCFRVSLRSASDAVDVSAMARAFGGGGHRRASGFTHRGREISELFVVAGKRA